MLQVTYEVEWISWRRGGGRKPENSADALNGSPLSRLCTTKRNHQDGRLGVRVALILLIILHIFSGASLTSAAKKPFPNSFLKNALGTQDFSNEKDVGTSGGPAPQRSRELNLWSTAAQFYDDSTNGFITQLSAWWFDFPHGQQDYWKFIAPSIYLICRLAVL